MNVRFDPAAAAGYTARLRENSGVRKRSPGDKPTSPSSTREQVNISAASIDMQKLRNEVNNAADVRLPLVQEIKERIDNNDYPLENALYRALEKMLQQGIVSVPA